MRRMIQILQWTGILATAGLLPSVMHGAEGGASAQIYVTSDPSGAALFCDGRGEGQTPATITNIALGEHLLAARKNGWHEARLTVTIRPGERTAVEMKLEPVTGLMLIHSQPQGAEIEIDNANYGKTPRLISDFPLGQHRVKVSAPGYQPKITDVRVEDRTPQKLVLALISDTARLLISSEPAGAEVTLDNAGVGQTPCEVPRVSSGKHKVELNLKGFSAYSDEIMLQAGDERKIAVKLSGLPSRLAVVSVPPKARIYVNNQFKGEAPFTTDAVFAGKNIIRAELPGYAVQVHTNELVPGEETVVEFQMVKNSGKLLITTEPPSVSIYLDGEARGVTAAIGDEPLSDQFTVDLVPQGQHKLQFTRQGYFDATKAVEVKPNQNIILHEKLRPRPVPFVPNIIIRTGTDAEHMFRGVVREKYANGDIKVEIEPGIFQTFKASEIIATEPIKTP